MNHQLSLGQRVQLKADIQKYGGLFGEIIHREWVTGDKVYRRERPEARTGPSTGLRAGQGRLALVIQLEDPPPDLEPVILCYEEHVSPASAR